MRHGGNAHFPPGNALSGKPSVKSMHEQSRAAPAAGRTEICAWTGPELRIWELRKFVLFDFGSSDLVKNIFSPRLHLQAYKVACKIASGRVSTEFSAF